MGAGEGENVTDRREIEQSLFNEGSFQIQRLHNLWEMANRQSMKPRTYAFSDYRWTLNAIWRELSRDALRMYPSEEEDETFQERMKNNPIFKERRRLEKSIRDAQNPEERYTVLQEYEMFLRNLQDEVGKGTKVRDSDEDEMD